METDYMIEPDAVRIDGTGNASVTLVLAHGAGAGMETPYMNYMAAAAVAAGFRVVRFEFPYMTIRRQTGSRRPPDRAPKLLTAFAGVIHQFGQCPVIIGGKSMGGRMASLLAAEGSVGIDGVLCLGYPFRPPGKKMAAPRTRHFKDIGVPVLICQGERDPFGGRDYVEGLNLPSNFTVHWLADGDHDFRPRKKSGLAVEQNWQSAMDAVASRFL